MYTLTLVELEMIQAKFPWLPYSADLYDPKDLRKMTWAGRLLVQGWNESDSETSEVGSVQQSHTVRSSQI